jgi:hypothetical protein
MTIESFRELLDHYLLGNLTEEERRQFSQALKQPGFATELEKVLEETFMNDTFEGDENPARRKRMFRLLEQKIASSNSSSKQKHFTRILLFKRVAAAAVILLAIAGAVYFVAIRKPAPKDVAVLKENRTIKEPDVMPGHKGATLRLSDGSIIILDSAQNGTLAIQGNMQVVKENGQILYKGKNGEVLYNNISTDKGRQWSVVLPDGSKVWLNAESSIHYPLTFSGKERVVEVTGEAYFEVTHNKHFPFKVKVNDKEIEVLGTHFNINSYEDEPSMRATLLEGLIRIGNGVTKKIIRPGQEASILNNATGINITEIDVQNAIAWKNGYFSFHNANLKAVMRQLARWYDIDVIYVKQAPDLEFEGAIDQSLKLSAVLRILEKTGVHFKIGEDKKLFILP